MSVSLFVVCSATTFSPPSVYGAEILSIEASLVTNYSASVPDVYRYTQPSTQLQNATFCNVTVLYTHPGQNDKVIVEAWLPVDNWNGRFQAVGGGGWVPGRFFLSYDAMNGALADGYATITTDAGLGASLDATPWALLSPGNVDLLLLQNLASVSLNDEAIIGKSLIKSFYGKVPEYSYWNGCSQGGRQGLMLAQRYPTAYDGIATGAPAIHWTKLFSYLQWPQRRPHGNCPDLLFVAGDPDLDFTNLTHAEFDRLAHLSGQMYNSVISTDDPDLSAFCEAGGKLVTFHGLADSIIPPKGTEQYYNAVASVVPDIDGFYRHYEVPGLGHCFGGRGGQPTNLFAQLRAWVEHGTAPGESLGQITDLEGKTQHRILCPYPQRARLDSKCGNSTLAACWSCVDHGGVVDVLEAIYEHRGVPKAEL
ncbi:tannase and feruloyl esterase [Parachaetomium inaequale]|uniref:Carboxylic ester hydrolase n=1 Tax=Parachaetomium inaequale TaxID=2588326 RepID=A0AAN6SSN4_9PEZI|nr:tannase and feruloyl esterase [Parachaetomium inaequale]